MNFSDPTLVWLALLIAVPSTVLLVADFLARKRGGVMRGWKGTVFIALCWVGAFAVIIHRVAS